MLHKNVPLEKIIFNNLIQAEISVNVINDDGELLIKTGKLLNFNIKLPFLYFSLVQKGKTREFHLPQPFKFAWNGEELRFSYQLKDMGNGSFIVDKLRKMGDNSDSKYFDRDIIIKPIIHG